MTQQEWYKKHINYQNKYSGKGVNVGVYEVGGVIDNNQYIQISNKNGALYRASQSGKVNPDHAIAVSSVIKMKNNTNQSLAEDVSLNSYSFTKFCELAVKGHNNHVYRNIALQDDVVNNSFSMTSGFLQNVYSEVIANDSQLKTSYGRDGLGTNLVFGSGNRNFSVIEQSANDKAHSNLAEVISVSGVMKDGSNIEHFAEGGSAVFVAAPAEEVNVLSNKTGPLNNATKSGTSFAAPIVTSVISQMLEANPDLGWRDVKDILAYCAKINHNTNFLKNNDQIVLNGAKTLNGGGLYTSYYQGFGEINADAALRLAENWPKQQITQNMVSKVYRAMKNGKLEYDIVVNDELPVEHAQICIDVTKEHLNYKTIELISPNGTKSELLSEKSMASYLASSKDGTEKFSWSFGSNQFKDESAKGKWKIVFKNVDKNNKDYNFNNLDPIYKNQKQTDFVNVDNLSLKLAMKNEMSNQQLIVTNDIVAEYESSLIKGPKIPGVKTLQIDKNFSTLNLAALTEKADVNLEHGLMKIGSKVIKLNGCENINKIILGDSEHVVRVNKPNSEIHVNGGKNKIFANGVNNKIIIKSREDIGNQEIHGAKSKPIILEFDDCTDLSQFDQMSVAGGFMIAEDDWSLKMMADM